VRKQAALLSGLLVLASIVGVSGDHAGAASDSHQPVGASQTLVSGTGVPYSVKLVTVINPATPATRTFGAPAPGTRFVASEFTITNKGHVPFTNDANLDASIIGSNDQVYSATFNTVTDCTNFASGRVDLLPGDSETGCVVFDIPSTVAPAHVKWASTDGIGSTVEWTVTTVVPPVTTAPLPAPATFKTFTRIYGQTADATAAAELEHQFPYGHGQCVGTPTFRSVVLATDATYPDALAGAYLAGIDLTGTLLTSPTSLSTAAQTAIRDEGVTFVYVLGGSLAISTGVVSELESMPVYACGGTSEVPGRKMTVDRIFGQSQYTTAAQVAEFAATGLSTHPTLVGSAAFPDAYSGTNALGGTGSFNETSGLASSSPSKSGKLPTAVLATGKGFQDAMAAGVMAYEERMPILLTTPSVLSPQASSAIRALGIEQVIVMGGPLAVSNGIVTTLEGLGVSVLRIAGQSYGGTSVELAEFESGTATTTGLGWAGTGGLTIARGNGFTDGLAGAVVADGASALATGSFATSPTPLLLTQSPTVVGTTLATFLRRAGTAGIGGVPVSRFTILGGPFAVTQATINAMGADL